MTDVCDVVSPSWTSTKAGLRSLSGGQASPAGQECLQHTNALIIQEGSECCLPDCSCRTTNGQGLGSAATQSIIRSQQCENCMESWCAHMSKLGGSKAVLLVYSGVTGQATHSKACPIALAIQLPPAVAQCDVLFKPCSGDSMTQVLENAFCNRSELYRDKATQISAKQCRASTVTEPAPVLSVFLHRANSVEQLLASLRFSSVPEEDRASVIRFLATHAFFAIKDGAVSVVSTRVLLCPLLSAAVPFAVCQSGRSVPRMALACRFSAVFSDQRLHTVSDTGSVVTLTQSLRLCGNEQTLRISP